MGVKKFGFDEIRQRVKDVTGYDASTETEIARRLQFIGEGCVEHARNNNGYTPRTGNLQSSISYRVYHNGELISEGGYTGSKEAIEAAKKALDRFPEENDVAPIGWTLVIVAGMSYATYVEAKGYNVLALTEAEMKTEIEELKKEMGL